jgi:hypothetical protein
MEGARWNPKPAVDTGVKVTRNPGHPVPLHEGETGSFPGIEEDMIDTSSLLNREGLMDDNPESERLLIE